jgi:hypothetical protein
MAALVKDHAFSFEHQPLKVGFLKDHAAGGDPSARIHYPMPRDVSLVVRRRVHRPPDEPRAVALFEQVCDLPVGHHSPSRDSQHKAVNLLKSLFEPPDAGTL